MRSWTWSLIVLSALLVLAMMSCEPGGPAEPEPVQEFRIAKPLGTEAALREQIETITAVTAPRDEVEAAAPLEEEIPIASTRRELERQCVTALKEVAFCTSEDAFLDLIGSVEGLQGQAERDRFMARVQLWFEPGGVHGDCLILLETEGAMSEPTRRMWQRVAGATEGLCPEFGSTLLEADAFRWLAGLWAEEAMRVMEGEL